MQHPPATPPDGPPARRRLIASGAGTSGSTDISERIEQILTETIEPSSRP